MNNNSMPNFNKSKQKFVCAQFTVNMRRGRSAVGTKNASAPGLARTLPKYFSHQRARAVSWMQVILHVFAIYLQYSELQNITFKFLNASDMFSINDSHHCADFGTACAKKLSKFCNLDAFHCACDAFDMCERQHLTSVDLECKKLRINKMYIHTYFVNNKFKVFFLLLYPSAHKLACNIQLRPRK